jgi:hypothetical protein
MEEDVVLGRGWMDHQDVTIAPAKKSIYIHSKKFRVSQVGKNPSLTTQWVGAATFAGLIRRANASPEQVQIFAASLVDINKALEPKKTVNVKALLPKQYQDYFELFDPKEPAKLPPDRGPGIDHRIELEGKDGQAP